MLSCRVLVVEDERIVALNLQQRLRKLGYEVPVIVASGVQALAEMRRLHPDLVLMDINIEGAMDGIETVKKIPGEFDIPVIYLTAYSEDVTLERARETKPYGYLVKPFSERALHATIQMALERRNTDIALKESEERLRFALDAAEMESWELDLSPRKLLRIGPADRLFGLTQNVFTVTLEEFLDRVHPEDRAEIVQSLDRAIAERAHCQAEFRDRSGDGEARWLRLQGKVYPRRHQGSEVDRVIGVIQDVSERKRLDQSLRQAATVFNAGPDGIVVLDHDFRIVTANRRYCELVAMPLEKIAGERPTLLLDEFAQATKLKEIFLALRDSSQWAGEVTTRRNGAAELHMLAKLAAVRDERNELARFIGIFSDLSAVRSAEQKLFYLAHHDALTGLPNRLLARERLERALERAKRVQSRVALLFIDLDYFKRVNDTLGHRVGDELLRAIAQRMQTCVRSEDTVARLGGDEFMVILDHVAKDDDVVVVARKIIGALNQQVDLGSCSLSVSPSIGISLFPDHCRNLDDLISAADAAMYVAKQQGRNRYAFYVEEMTAATARYLAVDQELRRAVDRKEFVLHYQPQFSMRTGAIVGAEALIRWHHPTRGLLGPSEVITVAEDNGLIVDIGEWVLLTVCEQMRAWREAGLSFPRVAVNVSPRQMHDQRLLEFVQDSLQRFGLPAGKLEIEVTESTLQSASTCVTTLQQLRGMGVSIAVDDFGTGYSSLSSLAYLPINRLKIDRAFISEMETNANASANSAITDAIIALAHRLNIEVIAEGVETKGQEASLRASACDEAQGFLYAKPLATDAFLEFLRDYTVPENFATG